jgi:SAM-dependent methyltransferase
MKNMRSFFDKLLYIFYTERYWLKRHKKFGFDIRGVGNMGLTVDENLQQYEDGKRIVLELVNLHFPDVKKINVLDIGCGIGIYAALLQKIGVVNYTGIDITDYHFSILRSEYKNYSFIKKDICTDEIEGLYDLILMIDVTQHITSDKKFNKAMANISKHLAPSGIFLATSWLDSNKRNAFYERSRSIESYKNNFLGYHFSNPIPFRDKYIFTIKP